MTPFVAPRCFNPCSGLLEAGLPSSRAAAQAACAFVELRACFLQALDGLPGTGWLACQVWVAEAPVDLWLLRAPVFIALAEAGPAHQLRQTLLRREIDSTFPDLDSGSVVANI